MLSVSPSEGPDLNFDARVARRLLVLALVLAALSATFPVYFHLGRSPFAQTYQMLLNSALVNSALLGAYLAYLMLPWRRPEFMLITLLGVVGEVYWWYERSFFYGPYGRFVCLGCGLGLAAWLGLLYRVGTTTGSERRSAFTLLAIAVIDPVFLFCASWIMGLVSDAHPLTYDFFCYDVDYCLGWSPSFAAGRWLAHHFLFSRFVQWIYFSLPALLMVSRLMSYRFPRWRYNDAQLSCVWVGAVGPLLYNLMPVVGPGYFPGWPDQAPGLLVPVLAPFIHDLPRNGMPSLHTAWILCIYWNARGFGRKIAALAVVAVGFTLLSAFLASHYVVDYIGGVMFGLACHAASAQALAANRRWRMVCIAYGAAGIVGWIFLIRACPIYLGTHPAVTVPLALGLVVTSFVLEHLLRRSSMATADDTG